MVDLAMTGQCEISAFVGAYVWSCESELIILCVIMVLVDCLVVLSGGVVPNGD